MLRRTVLMAAVLALTASWALAQPTPKPAARAAKATTARSAAQPDQQTPPPPLPKPAKAPSPPPPPPPPKPKGRPINVQVEVVITDHRGSGTPVKKTVSMLVADQRSGMIRSDALVAGAGSSVPLHVDANPEILDDGKIRLGLNLSYDLREEGQRGDQPLRMTIRENSSMILESGKSMLVTQSADPVGDRQVTVEVKATILR